MEKNFTVHIFGYGETQYITEGVNIKKATSTLTSVQSLIDAIWAEKPADIDGGNEYYAINVFNYDKKSWLGKGEDNASFSVDVVNNLNTLIDAVIAEIKIETL